MRRYMSLANLFTVDRFLDRCGVVWMLANNKVKRMIF